MKRGIYIMMIGLMVISITGCYYDKADLVYPSTIQNCDTIAVRYSTNVVSILGENCYSCHGGAATGSGGIRLDNYPGLKARADNGILLQAITHSPGAPPMPKGGAKLSDCNIAIIRTWIRSGAPNN